MKSQTYLDLVADVIGHQVGWPTHILDIAMAIKESNPDFDADRFIKRATQVWEANYNPPMLDDSIPY